MEPTPEAAWKRRPWLAALLSFGIIGLGQLYNAQPRKTLFLLTMWICAAATALALSVHSFVLMGAAASVSLLIWFAGVVDAFRSARRLQGIKPRGFNRWYVYLIFAAGFLLSYEFVTQSMKMRYARAFKIPSTAMEPTLKPGDHILVDMAYFRSATPKRNDVVIFSLAENPDVIVMKRVVAIEGDTVEVANASLLLNGKKVETPNAIWLDGGRKSFGPAVVPPGALFLLGDNRDRSKDSRHWPDPFLPSSRLLGKVLYIYYPFERANIWVE